MKTINFITLLLLCPITIFSQQTKKPYFQQTVNYAIDVELNDKLHQLNASETIEYTNNSPDKLEYIYFHIWPNAYKKYNTALGKQKLENGETRFYHAKDEELGFIDGLNFTSKGKVLEWEYDFKNEDICRVFLAETLLPGETVEISTPFSVKLPKGIFSRLGHMGESYQITQWYPKPAVYDKDGWHQMPYLDQGEFYSEYGTFDVKITLPKNYIVGATGDLINGEKELEWLSLKAIETATKIETFDDTDLAFPLSNDTLKTLNYHQENVHDFAWFADKRYHVLKGEVELPHSKEKVTTWAMFTNNEAYLWKKSIEYLNDAIYYYSLWNGDYPYKQVTAVDGALSAGGGMEYPNVTVIGESGNDFGLETVIMHEVGHNWFYGILGSNERDHPWMDEGLNSLNENRYIETKYPNAKLLPVDSGITPLLRFFDLADYKHKASYELLYTTNARLNKDQAIEEKSANYTSMNYGGIVYSKTAIVFDYLLAYLGEEIFDKCMHHYFDEWKFKHPQPQDLRAIFEEETGKDLSWFFDDIIKTTKKIDYKITTTKKDTSNAENILLKVKNNGKINGPFSVSGIKNNEIVHTQWYEPIGNKKLLTFKKGDYSHFKIDANLDIPEINRKNNTLKTKGLFKTMEPFRLQLMGSTENPNKTQLFFTPIAGWNTNDNFMLGTAFYNSTIPSKKFEYVIAPLYAFGSKNLNGYANAFYHIMPNSLFQDVAIGIKSSSFSYLNFNKPNNDEIQALEYYKIAPQINFEFKKRNPRQFNSFNINYQFVNIIEEVANYDRDADGNAFYTLDFEDYYVNNLSFILKSKHPINPFLVTVNTQQSTNFVKLNLEANYRFAYRKPKTGLDIRLFVGRFLYNNNASIRFNYNLSGNSDYMYDHILLARNTTDGYLNQQAMITDGGFKNYTTIPSANKWLNAINIKSTLPLRFIGLYADAGLSGYTARDFKGNEVDEVSNVAYNFGATLIVVPNIFEIYFPIKMSSELNQLKYSEKIRFSLNLYTIKPFEMVRNLDL
ncbi:M1 family metallopeptidase [Vicingus serpentipes]|uniref:M1 family metallopeptidase n=1 Tax=Vicingus serpentipes TaxID=1926625 RepID=A0A5C6RZJ0_9FLAO|nr:M1 family metallopeptidase [Vicingus serpentipes]TXB67050.1 M1 family metallopeptidase [Vicingus serpentipes]